VLEAVQDMLLEKHGIDHITLQPERHDERAAAL
jgi:Co/Zn/Cd efflux system component